MARSKLRKGRNEKNVDRVSSQVVFRAFELLRKRYGVSFSDNFLLANDTPDSEKFRFFKAVLMLAPAVAIIEEKPVSIYGVGSFRVSESKSGRRRLRVRYAQSVSKFLSRGFERSMRWEQDFWKVLDSLMGPGPSQDASVLRTSGRFSYGVDED